MAARWASAIWCIGSSTIGRATNSSGHHHLGALLRKQSSILLPPKNVCEALSPDAGQSQSVFGRSLRTNSASWLPTQINAENIQAESARDHCGPPARTIAEVDFRSTAFSKAPQAAIEAESEAQDVLARKYAPQHCSKLRSALPAGLAVLLMPIGLVTAFQVRSCQFMSGAAGKLVAHQ